MNAELFEIPQRAHRKVARVLMHVIDAGDSGCDDGHAGIALFRCGKCSHQTDWTGFRTITEAKRGIPCPKCNEAAK